MHLLKNDTRTIDEILQDSNISFPELSLFDAMKMNLYDMKQNNISTDLYVINIPEKMHMVFSREFAFNTILMMQNGY